MFDNEKAAEDKTHEEAADAAMKVHTADDVERITAHQLLMPTTDAGTSFGWVNAPPNTNIVGELSRSPVCPRITVDIQALQGSDLVYEYCKLESWNTWCSIKWRGFDGAWRCVCFEDDVLSSPVKVCAKPSRPSEKKECLNALITWA